jgi:hypothetical protein
MVLNPGSSSVTSRLVAASNAVTSPRAIGRRENRDNGLCKSESYAMLFVSSAAIGLVCLARGKERFELRRVGDMAGRSGDRREFCRSHPRSGCKTARRRLGALRLAPKPGRERRGEEGLSWAHDRPLFGKLDNLLLCVADLDAAIAFYRVRSAIARRGEAVGFALPDTESELVGYLKSDLDADVMIEDIDESFRILRTRAARACPGRQACSGARRPVQSVV